VIRKGRVGAVPPRVRGIRTTLEVALLLFGALRELGVPLLSPVMTGASRQLGRHQNVEDHGLYSSDAPASTQVLDASVMLFSITPVGVIRHL